MLSVTPSNREIKDSVTVWLVGLVWETILNFFLLFFLNANFSYPYFWKTVSQRWTFFFSPWNFFHININMKIMYASSQRPVPTLSSHLLSPIHFVKLCIIKYTFCHLLLCTMYTVSPVIYYHIHILSSYLLSYTQFLQFSLLTGNIMS